MVMLQSVAPAPIYSYNLIWKTSDAWNSPGQPTWQRVPGPDPTMGVGFLMVDSMDANILYMGGGGGQRFSRKDADNMWHLIIRGTHVDQHVMTTTTTSGGAPMLLLGNDGGFWTSTNRGDTWVNKNSNLSTVDLTGCSLASNGTMALGGSLDNGTEVWTGTIEWTWKSGGDGEWNAFSNTDPDHYWLITNNAGSERWYVDDAGGWHPCDPGVNTLKRIRPRRAPNGNDLLAAAVLRGGVSPTPVPADLWKSTNFFDSFPNPPTCPPTAPTWAKNFDAASFPTPTPSAITAIAFAPSDSSSQTYAFAAGNIGEIQHLRFTTTNGSQWKDLDPTGMVPNRPVNAIAFHPTDRSTIYVALDGFNGGTPGNIFKTTNAEFGNPPTWVNVSPPVDAPMTVLAIDPVNTSTIYAGCYFGIWRSVNGGDPINGVNSWTPMLANGMPNMQVTELLFTPAGPAPFQLILVI